MTTTPDPSTHDHWMGMDEWWNDHEAAEPYHHPDEVDPEGQMPRRCAECDRPAYYDTATDEYHHAEAPEVGCFLIGPSDREADPTHPLVKS